MTEQGKLYRSAAGHAPLRRAGSLRRTSSIDICWPEGRGGTEICTARARDIVTPRSGGAPIIIAQDSYVAHLSQARTILSIHSNPPSPDLARLVGERGGGRLRATLAEALPDELARATPLYLLLDDLSGASLVSGWAWSQWLPDWLALTQEAAKDSELAKAFGDRAGICTGFAAGSSALDMATDRSGTVVPSLIHFNDPDGWHAMQDSDDVSLRRARRIDIWRDDVIHVDSAFQDSATTPAGGRAAVHEYSLSMTADPHSQKILSIDAVPHVLPFVECPGAILNMRLLIGLPLSELRAAVLAQLRGVAGCTHLNDALRALADVPILLNALGNRWRIEYPHPNH